MKVNLLTITIRSALALGHYSATVQERKNATGN